MQSENRAFFWFLILFVLAMLEAISFYPSLPDQVAIHFTLNGKPNGWSSKTVFLIFETGLQLFMFLTFWGLGKLIPKLPNSAINLPHKEYWLAPERYNETMNSLQNLLYNIGSITFLLLIHVNYSVAQSNWHPSSHYESSFWIVLVVWLIVLFYVLYLGIRQFRLPKHTEINQ